MPRHDALYWAICFAIVLFVHVSAALALISEPEPSDYGIKGPVATLDLPESFVTTDASPTDLAPGSKEEQSEATPPPKEETKPPEPEADGLYQAVKGFCVSPLDFRGPIKARGTRSSPIHPQ